MQQVEEKIYCKSLGKKRIWQYTREWFKNEEYFKDHSSNYCNKTIRNFEVATSYDVKCSVKGGGLSGQAVQSS